ncbi:uncharacterized protein [Hyperolius riggenbachi]|uniref:uncharacterized protein n=1 Tax=Hyperolius riggenbachi TaxID=752182 RepID=UPI0035A283F3
MATRRFINVEDLIMAVQEYPELYDKSHEKHSDLPHCKLLWERITKQFVDEYDRLAARKQSKEVEKIKTKWRSIRDSFIKELKAEKADQRSGSGASRRTPYCHTPLLRFLRPLVQDRGTEDNFEAILDDSNDGPALSILDESPDTSMDTLTTVNLDDIADDELPSVSAASSAQPESPGEGPPTQRPNTAESLRKQASARVSAARGQARSANVQMAGAVSSLVGMMKNQESIVSRSLQDKSGSTISHQYQQHIDTLRTQLAESNEMLRKERQLFQEQLHNLGQQHRQQIDLLMHHQSSSLYHSVMSLLPLMEQVPRHRLIHCQCSLLDAVKNHLDYSAPPTRPPSAWQPSPTQPYHGPSPNQSYQGYQPPHSFPITSAEETTTYTQLSQGSTASTHTSASSQPSSGKYPFFPENDNKF